MTKLHPATTPLLLAGLLILALAAALSALFSEPERMRSWSHANGRHTPIQNDTPQSLTRECQRGHDSRKDGLGTVAPRVTYVLRNESSLRTNTSDVLRKKLWKSNESNIRLPSPDAPPEKRYSMPNPEHRPEAWGNVHAWIYSQGPQPCREGLQQVLSMANGYRHLTMYELGQEHCVRQLRDIWRARRAKAEVGE